MLPDASFDILGKGSSVPLSKFLLRLLSSAPHTQFSFTIDEILDRRTRFVSRGTNRSWPSTNRSWPTDVFALLGAVNAKSAALRVSNVVAYALDMKPEYACTGCEQAKVNCYRADVNGSGISTVKCSACIRKGGPCTLNRNKLEGNDDDEEDLIQCVKQSAVDETLAAKTIILGNLHCGSWEELLWGLEVDGHWATGLSRQWVADVFEPISTRKGKNYTVLLGGHVPTRPFDRCNKSPILVALPHHLPSSAVPGGPARHLTASASSTSPPATTAAGPSKIKPLPAPTRTGPRGKLPVLRPVYKDDENNGSDGNVTSEDTTSEDDSSEHPEEAEEGEIMQKGSDGLKRVRSPARKAKKKAVENVRGREPSEPPFKRHRIAAYAARPADDSDGDEEDPASLDPVAPVLSKTTIDLAVDYHRDRLEHMIVNMYDPADRQLASRWLDRTMEECRDLIETDLQDLTDEDQARTIMDKTLALLMTALSTQPVFGKKCTKPLVQPNHKQRKRQ